MSTIKIEGFDPEKLEDLAEKQTVIYNAENSKLPNYSEAKVENTIKRFKRKTFDQSRMFYAYAEDQMVGYVGLTGKDQTKNERGVGYPWLADGTDTSVRNLLYDAMEEKCRSEGTKTLRVYGSPQFPAQLDFFKSKDFTVKIEFIVLEKQLSHNDFELPAGYKFRAITREDAPLLEEISKKDPKMKSPIVASNLEQWIDSENFNSDNAAIAVYNGTVVGFYRTYFSADPKSEKVFFAGVAIHSDHQDIEQYLIKEMENRAIKDNKTIFQITTFPDSPRLPQAKENGFVQTSNNYLLNKELQ